MKLRNLGGAWSKEPLRCFVDFFFSQINKESIDRRTSAVFCSLRGSMSKEIFLKLEELIFWLEKLLRKARKVLYKLEGLGGGE